MISVGNETEFLALKNTSTKFKQIRQAPILSLTDDLLKNNNLNNFEKNE